MRRYIAAGLVVLAIGFVGIQFVPVERTNPMGVGDPDAPREVQWILRRACYGLPLERDAMAALGLRRTDVLAGGR